MQAGSYAGFNGIGFLASGSQILAVERGRFQNACMLHADGVAVPQAKNILTDWEKRIGISAGSGLVYERATRCGVTICLDAEFPASGRALAEAGMLFQCVPAWTETMHGFQRVRWACQARAVENQVCVIHSSLVGRVGTEESHGSSAIIVPPHEPFPLDPILAETPMDEEGVAIAEVEPNDLLKCRETGEVRNWRDRDAGDWRVTPV
jgi:predicted amidohydrolase